MLATICICTRHGAMRHLGSLPVHPSMCCLADTMLLIGHGWVVQPRRSYLWPDTLFRLLGSGDTTETNPTLTKRMLSRASSDTAPVDVDFVANMHIIRARSSELCTLSQQTCQARVLTSRRRPDVNNDDEVKVLSGLIYLVPTYDQQLADGVPPLLGFWIYIAGTITSWGPYLEKVLTRTAIQALPPCRRASILGSRLSCKLRIQEGSYSRSAKRALRSRNAGI
ncbi:hypothetical protein OBBRIDRAFT_91499 [Obba rivulosa]|uniref:Uncharacterized protein n=1 Tax=Obba rivulosa TaxID=1052685 RepID=A0A8E2AZH3_9APHY|nr:hypothetical protein OBBRIDRAFT_91499 [Obba rivulosa]